MINSPAKIQVKIIPKIVSNPPKQEDPSKEEKKRVLELVIDKREVHGDKIGEFFAQKNINIVHENLDIGDLLFRYRINEKFGNLEEFENLILIERKTISDMLSSIKSDGRYKEQKTRLKAIQQGQPNLRVLYLIEGIFSVQKTDRFFTEIDRKIMSGAYIGTIVRDEIPVIQTKDFNDTVSTLQKIQSLIIEYPEAFSLDSAASRNNSEYMVPIKIKKSENRDARWCYLAILQQIQGVSDQVAFEIAEVYPNLQSLMEAYSKASFEGKNHASLLENLVLSDRKLTKTGKTRAIGPALSETIWISLGSPK
jgi:ERCC4-type nuclease